MSGALLAWEPVVLAQVGGLEAIGYLLYLYPTILATSHVCNQVFYIRRLWKISEIQTLTITQIFKNYYLICVVHGNWGKKNLETVKQLSLSSYVPTYTRRRGLLNEQYANLTAGGDTGRELCARCLWFHWLLSKRLCMPGADLKAKLQIT